MAQPLIYTAGRAIVDLYAQQLNQPLTQVQSFQKYLGGSSANTAVGLARLGNAVGLIARVGSDPMGDYILDVLAQEHIDSAQMQRDDTLNTGLAFAALYPPHDSQVWFCGVPNANAALDAAAIDAERLKEASACVIAGTLLAQEPGRTAARALMDRAGAWGVPVVLDVDWRPMFWGPGARALEVYESLLPRVSVVLANEPELALVGQSPDVKTGCQRLLDSGVSEVVAKRGQGGSWYYARDQVRHMPAFSVSVMNTLGAGDGFAAGYVHGYVRHWAPEDRLRWASAVGAIVVSRHSCSEAMPTRAEVQEFLNGVSQGGDNHE